jgi:hypothetical protein
MQLRRFPMIWLGALGGSLVIATPRRTAGYGGVNRMAV